MLTGRAAGRTYAGAGWFEHDEPTHLVNGIIGLLYYGSAAFVIVRWGLLRLLSGRL